MPFSIAACRTVLPFSTVTARPSIVSVTVPITSRSYQTAMTLTVRLKADTTYGKVIVVLRLLDVDERVALADFDGAERALERHALLDDAVGDRHDDVDDSPVGVLQNDGDRQVED